LPSHAEQPRLLKLQPIREKSGQCNGLRYTSPRLSERASSAARSDADAPVYLSIMSRVDQPATAIKPPSEPPARNHRVAAVWPGEVDVEVSDAGPLGAVLQSVPQTEVGEPLPPVPKPENIGPG
jgi:hypothetical protein